MRKAERCFKTLDIILDSRELDQDYRDKVFQGQKISSLLSRLARYDRGNSTSQEKNKQAIAYKMIEIGLQYFQDRYSQTKFLSSKIQELKSLLSDLQSISGELVEEDEALRLYRMRGKLKMPPKILPSRDEWQAMCDICWRSASGNDKMHAMKSIRHETNCTYDKKDLERCIRTFLPTG
ncbi:hypothetical protein [Candidatus Nitrososphaera sp. FF02]|uniref:hypothetical protein n=1 Tax=Candidatus Nitrososphaera sp. FF02 TaxID=3398226 RepID=UPI0039EA24FC